jgi:UDP:flavonoid glycosyltransferase YjiC (YdhE family)
MESPTDADDEVASWIAAGTPPIYFGFGSMPVESPADTIVEAAGLAHRVLPSDRPSGGARSAD